MLINQEKVQWEDLNYSTASGPAECKIVIRWSFFGSLRSFYNDWVQVDETQETVLKGTNYRELQLDLNICNKLSFLNHKRWSVFIPKIKGFSPRIQTTSHHAVTCGLTTSGFSLGTCTPCSQILFDHLQSCTLSKVTKCISRQNLPGFKFSQFKNLQKNLWEHGIPHLPTSFPSCVSRP